MIPDGVAVDEEEALTTVPEQGIAVLHVSDAFMWSVYNFKTGERKDLPAQPEGYRLMFDDDGYGLVEANANHYV